MCQVAADFEPEKVDTPSFFFLIHIGTDCTLGIKRFVEVFFYSQLKDYIILKIRIFKKHKNFFKLSNTRDGVNCIILSS